jgi:hypothetical protein
MSKRLDIFPAVMKIAPAGSLDDFRALVPVGAAPEGTRKLDRCRVTVVNNTIFVVVDSPTGPELVFREKVQDFEKIDKIGHILTESGKIIAVTKDANCGCGSRLKSWNPFGAIAMSMEDPE